VASSREEVLSAFALEALTSFGAESSLAGRQYCAVKTQAGPISAPTFRGADHQSRICGSAGRVTRTEAEVEPGLSQPEPA
jgi:hypothetical protein